MNPFMQFVKQHSLVAYFILAYAFTWILTPLIFISQTLGIFGLFGPALAAVLVTAATDGRAGVKDLFRRLLQWRVNLLWYGVVLALPILISAAVVALSLLFGFPGSFQWQEISILSLVVFVLVVGEEIGWRGYALPKMLAERSAVSSSLILGLLWGLWHLPTFLIPGLPQANIPLIAFLVYVTGLSVLFTWIFMGTRGSLLLSTLFHGAVNTFGFTNPALDPGPRWWLTAAIYAAAAILIFLAAGPNLSRKPTVQAETVQAR